ncbi:hypothetical protein Sango_2859300 [Sesamum angolense]|uniref:DDE Tnp4 domain-containing protein n=1 Tax=Sesamum angolense TaxID=2727404 RepID=A0AAE1T6N9_9LAMI|nr:hypothetical protein Sango_2859300 [Sesamum angolense]
MCHFNFLATISEAFTSFYIPQNSGFLPCLRLYFPSNNLNSRRFVDAILGSRFTIGDHRTVASSGASSLHIGILWKGCLGALDGTHIEVRVPDSDKGRYRNRKGLISTNVLGLCNIEGMFTYVLSGWEGSAVDGRVLRDAVHRSAGIKVPTGNYYLCDNGYRNVEGFLTPYRGVRYHLKEWDRGNGGPQRPRELPDEAEMPVDHGIEVVSTLDATPQWTAWRDALATDMYTEWTHRH